MNRFVTASLGLILSATSALAGTIVRCETQGMSPVTILLDMEEQFGKSLNCIEASFIYDLTPCAPKGGYGLSNPRGRNELVAVVDDPAKAEQLNGGVVSFFSDRTQLLFIGGRLRSDQWQFSADRNSGLGLYTRQGRVIEFACHRAKYLEHGVSPTPPYSYEEEPVIDK